MGTPNQRSQSDLYQKLFKSGESYPYVPTVMDSLLRQHAQHFKPSPFTDLNDFWYLLRFHKDGVLHSVHRSSGSSEDSGTDLAQLLASEEDYDFQIMVYAYGRHARADAINTLNKAWRIPDHLWRAILRTDSSVQWSIGGNPEEFGVMSTQSRSMSVSDNHLYIPDASSGNRKTAIIFRDRDHFLWQKWSVNPMTPEPSQIHLEPSESTLSVKIGVYGMLTWLADRAYQRQCVTEKDFVFLCAEALLRGTIMQISSEIYLLYKYKPENDPRLSDRWFKQKIELMTCQDMIQNLSSWIDNHCSKATDKDHPKIRKRILRQYEQKIQSQERALSVAKQGLDLAFAKTGEKMAQESISEVKFSKILTIVAIVYLPVSVASSIFGMNIQELNGQGVGIIWFIVAIFAALGALLLCWLFFAFMANQRAAIKAKLSHKVIDPLPRSWVQRFWFIGMTRERVAYWPYRMYEAFMKLIGLW